MENTEKKVPQGPPPMDMDRAGNSNSITRKYFDSLLFQLRYIDGGPADITTDFFGETFSSPIMTAALSHMGQNGTVEQAKAAKELNVVNWIGLCPDDELRRVCATGARTVRIIKPFANEDRIFHEIRVAEECGCIAVGMDIDHAFDPNGRLCVLEGEAMESKTREQLSRYAKSTMLPFIAKGVLSVSDAVKCADAGLSGIVVSHHGGKMDYAVPPVMILPKIKAAVGDRMKIFVDCGIESGHDAFKALALGADGVSVGKPLLKALMKPDADGTEAAKVLAGYNDQLKAVMEFTACRNLGEITPDIIVRT